MLPALSQPGVSTPAQFQTDTPRHIHQVATEFEAVFLAEMLQAAGAGAPAGDFGGGIGEDQFASFLVEQHARAIAARGGIGLAEMIVRSLSARSDQGEGAA